MPDQPEVVPDKGEDVFIAEMVSRALRDQKRIAFRDLHRGELRLRPFVDAPEAEPDGARLRFYGIEFSIMRFFGEEDGVVEACPSINGFPFLVLL